VVTGSLPSATLRKRGIFDGRRALVHTRLDPAEGRTTRMHGPLEWILDTPAHHRVHHACNVLFGAP
jgi:hypothetical protein